MPLTEAAAALIGTGITALANTGSVFYSNWQSRRLADEQYRRQQEDIRLQNAYNSPAAQMVRLKAAGINPALYYGSGHSIESGEQSTIPQYDRAEVATPTIDASSVVQSFTDVSRLANEKSKLDKDLKLLQQTFDFNEQNNPILINKAKQELTNLRENEKKIVAETENLWSQYGVNDAQAKRICQQMDIDWGNFVMACSKFPHEIWSMDAKACADWMLANKYNEDVKIAWAMLNETVRHNKATETLGWKTLEKDALIGLADYSSTMYKNTVEGAEKSMRFLADLMNQGAQSNPLMTILAGMAKGL